MKKPHIQIAPSILAGDFGRIADEARRVEDSGADFLHIDVMDGNFVPNLTIGPQVVAAINRATNLTLDVHMMVYHPYDYVERFVQAGADRLSFHFEATEDVEETLLFIRRCGIQAGLAFSPETSMSLIPKFLDQCDFLLLMTVEPGFGGQAFMPDVLEKIRFTRDILNQLDIGAHGVVSKNKSDAAFDIAVDGGIDLETAAQCAAAGANIFVAGSHLFQKPDLRVAIQELRHAAEAAERVASPVKRPKKPKGAS